MPRRPLLVASVVTLVVATLAACSGNDPVEPGNGPDPVTPTTLTCSSVTSSGTLTPRLLCPVSSRYTAELTSRTVNGTTYLYTSTWGRRSGASCTPNNCGNVVYVWNVSSAKPGLVDSLIVSDVTNTTTTGDVQVTDDGSLLVVATEPFGQLVIYSLADPAHPKLVTRYSSPNLSNGVHTAQISRVNGKLYCFCSIDPRNGAKARLTIVDLSTLTAPTDVFTQEMGTPYVHDVYVRDGYLFTALWNDGVSIWDIGALGTGTPASPKLLGNVKTVNGQVHNIYWGGGRFAFVGEEGPGAIGTSSQGDIHVIDVSDKTKPREVAMFSPGAVGVHNFSVDEARGLLYAAYYNGGVQVLDITGDLAACTAAQKTADGRCDLDKSGHRVATGLLNVGRPVYVWGVEVANGVLYASDMLGGLWVFDRTP